MEAISRIAGRGTNFRPLRRPVALKRTCETCLTFRQLHRSGFAQFQPLIKRFLRPVPEMSPLLLI
jgi:hypothetical protein